VEISVSVNPRVAFIGAHVGCNAEDLGWVEGLLDTCPIFSIDIADRLNELGRKPRATRKLILKHSKRVMLGTDNGQTERVYRRYLRFLATDDECFPYSEHDPPPTGRWSISAVDLSDDVLADVVSNNARRLIPSFG